MIIITKSGQLQEELMCFSHLCVPALSMDDQTGNFEVGKDFDALRVNVAVPDGPIDLIQNVAPKVGGEASVRWYTFINRSKTLMQFCCRLPFQILLEKFLNLGGCYSRVCPNFPIVLLRYRIFFLLDR